jgi:hypothetical protein
VSHRVTDVKKRKDVSALTELACDRYGQLDVLISNAGIGPISWLSDVRIDDWEAMADINLKGLLYGIAAALPTALHAARSYRLLRAPHESRNRKKSTPRRTECGFPAQLGCTCTACAARTAHAASDGSASRAHSLTIFQPQSRAISRAGASPWEVPFASSLRHIAWHAACNYLSHELRRMSTKLQSHTRF